MKKLIVLLLALAMVGAVSAQVTTSIGLYGEVTFINQAGNAVFTDYGAGWDTLTFKGSDKDSKYGFSATYNNVLDTATVFGGVRDWNVWAKGKFTKVFLGKLRNADFRMTLPYWAGATVFGGTDRITGYGVLVETLPMNGLTFGVNLPIGTTADTLVNVLQKSDVGLKYDVKGFGTLIALANLDLVTPSNVVNVGFKYTGMKNLTAVVIGQAKFDANTYKAGLGFAYSGIDKLAANLEAAVTSTAGTLAYSVWAQGKYSVTDQVSATVGGSYADTGYDAYAAVGYDYGNGLSSEAKVGFDGAVYGALTLYYGDRKSVV